MYQEVESKRLYIPKKNDGKWHFIHFETFSRVSIIRT